MRLLIAIIKSAIFISSWALKLHFCNCPTKYMGSNGLRPTHPVKTVFICTLFTNLAIYFESVARMEETALYCAARMPDLFWNYMKKKFNAKSLPYFLNVLFALAIGLGYSAYIHDEDSIKSKYRVACEMLIGKDKKSTKIKELNCESAINEQKELYKNYDQHLDTTKTDEKK